MKRILVLGGGSSQITLLKHCRKMGLYTVLADISQSAPGREYCDCFEKVSTFDCAGSLEAASRNSVDAVATSGTDQPVYTSAFVAEKLGLPQFLSADQALSVTNKIMMKKILSSNSINTARYILINKQTSPDEITQLNPPYVLKPADSQGQRGVMKLSAPPDVKNNLDYVLSFSRTDTALLEEYYDSDEITLSGWVSGSHLFILSITDRMTFENPPAIGICASHQYPSSYAFSHQQEIISLTENIIKAFGIENGPIYFQYLAGKNGIYVNEIACRIGGAYEDEFIPAATGIDITELLVRGSLGEKITDNDFPGLTRSLFSFTGEYFTILLLFAMPGTIKDLRFPSEYADGSGPFASKFLAGKGTVILPALNSTQRAGYALFRNTVIENLNKNVKSFLCNTVILDEKGKNILYNNPEIMTYLYRRRFNA